MTEDMMDKVREEVEQVGDLAEKIKELGEEYKDGAQGPSTTIASMVKRRSTLEQDMNKLFQGLDGDKNVMRKLTEKLTAGKSFGKTLEKAEKSFAEDVLPDFKPIMKKFESGSSDMDKSIDGLGAKVARMKSVEDVTRSSEQLIKEAAETLRKAAERSSSKLTKKQKLEKANPAAPIG